MLNLQCQHWLRKKLNLIWMYSHHSGSSVKVWEVSILGSAGNNSLCTDKEHAQLPSPTVDLLLSNHRSHISVLCSTLVAEALWNPHTQALRDLLKQCTELCRCWGLPELGVELLSNPACLQWACPDFRVWCNVPVGSFLSFKSPKLLFWWHRTSL